MVIINRRDAENAKERWIFLSVDRLESEGEMKGRKEKSNALLLSAGVISGLTESIKKFPLRSSCLCGELILVVFVGI